MFLKNDMRPVTAGVAPCYAGKTDRQKQNDAFAFAGAGEAEDFNSFHPHAGRDDMNRSRTGRQTKKSAGPNKKTILIIAAAAVVLLLLILVVGVIVTRDKHITYKNNAYLAYADDTGNYHVTVNGTVLDYEFEGDVQVIPSADLSFAYVTDETADGLNIYLLEGTKLSGISYSAVSEAVSFASLKPGVIYRNDNKYYVYSERYGEEYFAKDVLACLISGDASTVVYTKADKKNAAETDLYLYQDSSNNMIASNCTPVALSNYGDYLYATSLDSDGNTNLYMISTKKLEKIPVPNSTGFTGFAGLNVKGNEVLFYTVASSGKTSTCLFRVKQEETLVLANSLLTQNAVDSSIAVYESFADTYFSGVTTNESGNVAYPTYHLSKKFECTKIASYSGKFSSDGNYFYYINNDSELRQMDLSDENRTSKMLFEDVVDFAITEKGNVYVLNSDDELRFYKLSTNKRTVIYQETTKISFYQYANKVYFAGADDADVNVFISEEGSEKSIAKFGSTQISNVPSFTNTNSKKTYAYYYDSDNGALMLFYTSNGKSFKLITQDCEGINGIDIDYN